MLIGCNEHFSRKNPETRRKKTLEIGGNKYQQNTKKPKELAIKKIIPRKPKEKKGA